jgi:hypothetical protein
MIFYFVLTLFVFVLNWAVRISASVSCTPMPLSDSLLLDLHLIDDSHGSLGSR